MISPETLRRYPQFAGLGEAGSKHLAMMGGEGAYERDDILFEETSTADRMFVITLRSLMERDHDIGRRLSAID